MHRAVFLDIFCISAGFAKKPSLTWSLVRIHPIIFNPASPSSLGCCLGCGRIGGSLGVSAAVWSVLVAIVVKIQLVVRAIEWPLRIGGDSVLNLVVWELLLELVSCSKGACPFVFVFLGDLFAGRGAGVRKGLVRGCGSLHSDLRFDTLAFEVRSFLAPHLLVT